MLAVPLVDIIHLKVGKKPIASAMRSAHVDVPSSPPVRSAFVRLARLPMYHHSQPKL